ncbi:MAG: DMT family transporter [Desulfocurvibacter africanus]
MHWFPASLTVAFLAASEAALLKKFFGRERPLQMAALPMLYILPVFLPLLAFMLASGRSLAAPAEFWWVTAALVPLNSLGLLLQFAAVNLSPLSLTMPLLSFTPAFVVFIGYAWLGETVSPAGMAGIMAIVAGSYVLNLGSFRRNDVLAPFKALFREPGSRMMLWASLIYALCAVMGKRQVQLMDPFFSAVVFWCLAAPFILLTLRLTGHIRIQPMLRRPTLGLAVGLAMSAHFLLHMYAVALIQTAYMISIKRLSGLFSVLLGMAMFGERKVGPQLAGSLLMFLGVLGLTLGG